MVVETEDGNMWEVDDALDENGNLWFRLRRDDGVVLSDCTIGGDVPDFENWARVFSGGEVLQQAVRSQWVRLNEPKPPRVVHALICDSVSASTATKTTNEK